MSAELAPAAGNIARCPWCNCRIIDTTAATKVEKKFENIDLPPSETAASDAESSAASASAAAAPAPAPSATAPATAMSVFWSANQWAYDNIGVSKPPTVDARHRFLTCADCDRGPLGVCFPKDEPEQLYLAADRVKYTEK